MIRAIFFDFYSVWTPDKISYYLSLAQQAGPEVYKDLSDVAENYYHGRADITYLADCFSLKLGDSSIGINQFKLEESDISPAIISFMRNLHGHFLKLGILANLGTQEYEMLNNFNQRSQLFEVIASPLSFQMDEPLLSQVVFAKALQSIGEPLNSCVWVSGNRPYLEFAQGLGVGVVQFDGFPKLKLYLDSLISSELPE